MSDNSDPRRDELHEFLQSQGPASEDSEITGAAVLTAWVMVAEWMDTEGERWLARGWSASTPAWAAKGMIHEVLYGDW